MVHVTKGDKDHDSTMDRTTKSGFLSAEETSHAEAIQRLEAFGRHLEVKIETYQCENAATPEIQRGEEAFTSSSLFTDSSQQSEKITTPSRPWFYNPGSVALHSLGSDRQCVNDSGEESGILTVHNDLSEINRLRTKLQKVFHHLQVFYVLYIVTSTGLDAFLHVLCILIFSLQFAH